LLCALLSPAGCGRLDQKVAPDAQSSVRLAAPGSGLALIPQPPAASASALPSAGASAVPSASAAAPTPAPAPTEKYPAEPCEALAADFREYIGCWSEHTEGVRDDLEQVVAAQRKQGQSASPATAKLLKQEAGWESKRDATCNALDNGNMGQGLGSVGQLAVMKCRYEADRKRLAQLNATSN